VCCHTSPKDDYKQTDPNPPLLLEKKEKETRIEGEKETRVLVGKGTDLTLAK